MNNPTRFALKPFTDIGNALADPEFFVPRQALLERYQSKVR